MAFILSSLTTFGLSPIAETLYLLNSLCLPSRKSNQKTNLDGSSNTNRDQYLTY